MKIIDKYIIKTLFSHTLATLAVLISIYSFFSFLAEVPMLGIENYKFINLLEYVILTMPQNLYALSPVIILLGVILGLGSLANSSELIVLRSAGISINGIVIKTLKAGLIFVIFIILIGELVAPKFNSIANLRKAKALNKNITLVGKHGFWMRDKNKFINVQNNLNNKVLTGVTLFKTSDNSKLDDVTYSEKVSYDDKNLISNNTENYTFINKGLDVREVIYKKSNKKSIIASFDTIVLENITQPPKNLSIIELYNQITFLNKNKIQADIYEIEFYSRVLMPVTLIVMILLAIPFVFGSIRDKGIGKKVFIGIILSVFFQLISKLSSQSTLFYGYNSFLGAFMPTFIIFLIASFTLYRVSLK